jgi:predicted DNA-binding WGR domain protein
MARPLPKGNISTKYRAGAQLQVCINCKTLRRAELLKNMMRFLLLRAPRDFFRAMSLVREWGRLGGPGQMRVDHDRDDDRALNAFSCLGIFVRKRRYV